MVYNHRGELQSVLATRTRDAHTTTWNVDVRALPLGVYMIRLSSGGGGSLLSIVR
ncbi:MAG: hypothetical protein H7X80_00050 [bacterium]|nr:hypothetical protein [Candidatus Kapabacteria bacterium]